MSVFVGRSANAERSKLSLRIAQADVSVRPPGNDRIVRTHDHDLRSRRVVLVSQSGTSSGRITRLARQTLDIRNDLAQAFDGNSALPEENRRIARAIDDRGFEPDLRRVILKDAIDPTIEIFVHRFPSSRTRPT